MKNEKTTLVTLSTPLLGYAVLKIHVWICCFCIVMFRYAVFEETCLNMWWDWLGYAVEF